MGDPTGFLKLRRSKGDERAVTERLRDWDEFALPVPEAELRSQASRCMDCGIPFCHTPVERGGCPLNNLIPEWNDLVYKGQMGDAVHRLHATNNFPEITGRVCPAPCEASCVLALDDEAVTIKSIEKAIAQHALDAGLVPAPPPRPTGRKVGVIGSGPAGMAAAQQLARMGHAVTLYERDDRIGGLLRYGIPDFKLERAVLDARLQQMEAEGVVFKPGVDVGGACSVEELRTRHDALILCCGARRARDLEVPGRELQGVHFAMDFLTAQNRVVAGDDVADRPLATGKRVVVLGGGDTGSDCVGTSHRQGAQSVLQLELMPMPPERRGRDNPWPAWPMVFRSSSSHEEGGTRDFSMSTQRVLGDRGRVRGIEVARVERRGGGFEPVAGTLQEIPCDLLLLAMGFTGPEGTLADQLGLERDRFGNVTTDVHGATSAVGIFAAGDMNRGQSLVVWAIADGRRVAAGVDKWLRSQPARPSYPAPSISVG